MGSDFRSEVRRTESFLKTNPLLYSKVTDDIRKAVLNRFPYSMFYTVNDDESITVLSVFHQSRKPVFRD
jgi:plasmid stabilization system protein ParE